VSAIKNSYIPAFLVGSFMFLAVSCRTTSNYPGPSPTTGIASGNETSLGLDPNMPGSPTGGGSSGGNAAGGGIRDCAAETETCKTQCGAKPECGPFDQKSADFCAVFDYDKCVVDKIKPWEDCIIKCNSKCQACMKETYPDANAENYCREFAIDQHSADVTKAVNEIQAAADGCTNSRPPVPGDQCKQPDPSKCPVGSKITERKVSFQCTKMANVAPAYQMQFKLINQTSTPQPSGKIRVGASCEASLLCSLAMSPTADCKDSATPNCISCKPIVYISKLGTFMVTDDFNPGTDSEVITDKLKTSCFNRQVNVDLTQSCIDRLSFVTYEDPTDAQTKTCYYCVPTASPTPTPTPAVDYIPE
jgi:hypothetical protein